MVQYFIRPPYQPSKPTPSTNGTTPVEIGDYQRPDLPVLFDTTPTPEVTVKIAKTPEEKTLVHQLQRLKTLEKKESTGRLTPFEQKRLKTIQKQVQESEIYKIEAAASVAEWKERQRRLDVTVGAREWQTKRKDETRTTYLTPREMSEEWWKTRPEIEWKQYQAIITGKAKFETGKIKPTEQQTIIERGSEYVSDLNKEISGQIKSIIKTQEFKTAREIEEILFPSRIVYEGLIGGKRALFKPTPEFAKVIKMTTGIETYIKREARERPLYLAGELAIAYGTGALFSGAIAGARLATSKLLAKGIISAKTLKAGTYLGKGALVGIGGYYAYGIGKEISKIPTYELKGEFIAKESLKLFAFTSGARATSKAFKSTISKSIKSTQLKKQKLIQQRIARAEWQRLDVARLTGKQYLDVGKIVKADKNLFVSIMSKARGSEAEITKYLKKIKIAGVKKPVSVLKKDVKTDIILRGLGDIKLQYIKTGKKPTDILAPRLKKFFFETYLKSKFESDKFINLVLRTKTQKGQFGKWTREIERMAKLSKESLFISTKKGMQEVRYLELGKPAKIRIAATAGEIAGMRYKFKKPQLFYTGLIQKAGRAKGLYRDIDLKIKLPRVTYEPFTIIPKKVRFKLTPEQYAKFLVKRGRLEFWKVPKKILGKKIFGTFFPREEGLTKPAIAIRRGLGKGAGEFGEREVLKHELIHFRRSEVEFFNKVFKQSPKLDQLKFRIKMRFGTREMRIKKWLEFRKKRLNPALEKWTEHLRATKYEKGFDVYVKPKDISQITRLQRDSSIQTKNLIKQVQANLLIESKSKEISKVISKEITKPLKIEFKPIPIRLSEQKRLIDAKTEIRKRIDIKELQIQSPKLNQMQRELQTQRQNIRQVQRQNIKQLQRQTQRQNIRQVQRQNIKQLQRQTQRQMLRQVTPLTTITTITPQIPRKIIEPPPPVIPFWLKGKVKKKKEKEDYFESVLLTYQRGFAAKFLGLAPVNVARKDILKFMREQAYGVRRGVIIKK